MNSEIRERAGGDRATFTSWHHALLLARSAAGWWAVCNSTVHLLLPWTQFGISCIIYCSVVQCSVQNNIFIHRYFQLTHVESKRWLPLISPPLADPHEPLAIVGKPTTIWGKIDISSKSIFNSPLWTFQFTIYNESWLHDACRISYQTDLYQKFLWRGFLRPSEKFPNRTCSFDFEVEIKSN